MICVSIGLTMKLLTLLSVVLVGVSGYLFKLPILPGAPKTENADWIHRQQLILSLFENVCDISNDPAIVRLAQDFTLDTTTGKFEDSNVTIRLKELISGKGLLPKGDIFSEYDPVHIEELQAISEVLCTALDFHTFYTAAAWARQNVNCGIFVDAIYLALMKRTDTKKLSVPAPYELLPNYFVNKETIITGSSLLSNIPIELGENVRNDGNSYIIDANYTSDIYDNDEQTKLAYFHEDIGLNTYYFLWKLSKLTWVKDVGGIGRNGEHIYHIMKQLATRYDLERYANGFDEVDGINWNLLDSTVYDPMLVYSNGQEFEIKSRNMNFKSPQDIVYLENIENSITTAVTHMIQSGSDKIKILGNLVEILVTGDKSYEKIAHQLLGTNRDDVKTAPSVLDHYMTSMRDPIFWVLNKKIVNIIDSALRLIPTYTKNELYFPGVKVMNVDIKKISTSFDGFEFDVTDALKPLDSDSTFLVKVAEPRLNHKPFAIKVNLTSLVAQKGLMKIFLGPKMLPGEFALKQDHFMLLDTCEIILKKGGNIITRTSEEINNLTPDFWSLRALRQNIEDAEFGIGNLLLENIQKLTGFPSRLIIPKGTEGGLPLQIFVFIAPFAKVNMASSVAEFNSAILSPSYPLDLTIDDKQLFDLPNAIVKEIIVTHKGSSAGKFEGGKGKNWDSDSYDFTAKKGQYGQKSYAEQRTSIEQQPKQHLFEIEKTTDKPLIVTEPKSYYLQMRPNRELFDYNSKRQYTTSNYGLKIKLAPSHRMLEKKPFDIFSSKDVNKNTNEIMPTEPIRDLGDKPIYSASTKDINKNIIDPNGTVSINIGKDKNAVMTINSTESNKVVNIDIEKNKDIAPSSEFTDKNVNINIDKTRNMIFPASNSFDTLDGKKSVKINVEKSKDVSISEKMGNTDGSLISREKIHENVKDIVDKYFPPQLEQEPQSTNKIPSEFGYKDDEYYHDYYDSEQSKVYE